MEPKQPNDQPVRDAEYWRHEAEANKAEKERVLRMLAIITRSMGTCSTLNDEDTQPFRVNGRVNDD